MPILGQAIMHLGLTYRSWDVRQVVVGENSVLSVIRLSNLSKHELEEHHAELMRQYGRVTKSKFGVDLFADDFQHKIWDTRLNSFLGSFARSRLELGRERLDKASWSPWGVNQGWPAWAANFQGKGVLGQALDNRVSQELIRARASVTDPMSYVSNVCEMPDLGTSHIQGIYLLLPIYARVDSAGLNEGMLRVHVSVHRNLRNCTVHPLRLLGGHPSKQEPLADPTPIAVEDAGGAVEGGDIISSELSFPMPAVKWGDNDYIQVDIAHHDLGEVLHSYQRRWTKSSLPTDMSLDALLTVLPHFLSWQEMEYLLLDPGGLGQKLVSPKNQSYVFEKAVTTLLALLGARAVHLGKWGFENFRGNQDENVDILAVLKEDGPLCLIGCTTGQPKAGDYDTLSRAAKSIQEEQKWKVSDLRRMVFCSIEAPAAKQDAAKAGVHLVDAEGIRGIIHALRDGRRDDVWHQHFDYWPDGRPSL